MEPLVVRKDHERVATLTLNRPTKLNALSIGVFEELRQQVGDIGSCPEIDVVVLRGAGRCFSAGHDLGDLLHAESSPHPYLQAHTIEALANLPQPVIALVHGHCYTGALELALAADILICGESARFADTHAKWALLPIWGLTQRLPRRIGMAKAKEMMLTGDSDSAAQALHMGLVNACVADDHLDEALAGWCAKLKGNSAFSHRGNKELLAATDGMSLKQGLAYEVYRTPGVGPDSAARIQAFLNRPRER
jgi:enoyl-CoA hydratase/carnithine racemase